MNRPCRNTPRDVRSGRRLPRQTTSTLSGSRKISSLCRRFFGQDGDSSRLRSFAGFRKKLGVKLHALDEVRRPFNGSLQQLQDLPRGPLREVHGPPAGARQPLLPTLNARLRDVGRDGRDDIRGVTGVGVRRLVERAREPRVRVEEGADLLACHAVGRRARARTRPAPPASP